MQHGRFDISAVDSEGRIVLVCELKAIPHGLGYAAENARRLLVERPQDSPFVFVADAEAIELYHWQDGRLGEVLWRDRLRSLLRPYDPEIEHRPLWGGALETLLTAWLGDLTTHWHSDDPPAAAEMRAIGLTSALVDADVTVAKRMSSSSSSSSSAWSDE